MHYWSKHGGILTVLHTAHKLCASLVECMPTLALVAVLHWWKQWVRNNKGSTKTRTTFTEKTDRPKQQPTIPAQCTSQQNSSNMANTLRANSVAVCNREVREFQRLNDNTSRWKTTTYPSPVVFWTSLGLIQVSSTGGGTGVDTVSVDTSPMIDSASFVAWYIRRTSSRRAASSGDSSISELCMSTQLRILVLRQAY